jgi:hypothetical protein
MCLSLHPDNDGSINRTRNTHCISPTRRVPDKTVCRVLTHEATINAYHNSTTMGHLREANTILVCSKAVILFLKAHHPISQVTQLLEQFPWKYLALYHRPCIWRPPTWTVRNSEEKHIWGNDKLKANVCQWM